MLAGVVAKLASLARPWRRFVERTRWQRGGTAPCGRRWKRVACSLDRVRYRIVPFARIDNLFDLKYINSVTVGQANGGSFEPVPGHTFFAGVKATPRQL